MVAYLPPMGEGDLQGSNGLLVEKLRFPALIYYIVVSKQSRAISCRQKFLTTILSGGCFFHVYEKREKHRTIMMKFSQVVPSY